MIDKRLKKIKSQIGYKRKLILIHKEYLSSTDYQAIKVAEGVMTAEEFAPTKAKRQEARVAINLLEAEISQLESQLENL